LSCLFFRTLPVAASMSTSHSTFCLSQFDLILETVEMVIQLGVGDRCTRMQVQSDFVQLFQRLDLAVLDQLRDLSTRTSACAKPAVRVKAAAVNRRSGFHRLLSLGERFEWDQVNCGNLIQPYPEHRWFASDADASIRLRNRCCATPVPHSPPPGACRTSATRSHGW
jgi:hypothetical protein